MHLKNKPQGGFSYLEILIAGAVFAVVSVVAIQSVLQAGWNLALAERNHAAHLGAQHVMLGVRDFVTDEAMTYGITNISHHDFSEAVSTYASLNGLDRVSVWIRGAVHLEVHFSEGFAISDAPIFSTAFSDTRAAFIGHSAAIYVITWNEHGHISGYAVGVAHFGVNLYE